MQSQSPKFLQLYPVKGVNNFFNLQKTMKLGNLAAKPQATKPVA